MEIGKASVWPRQRPKITYVCISSHTLHMIQGSGRRIIYVDFYSNVRSYGFPVQRFFRQHFYASLCYSIIKMTSYSKNHEIERELNPLLTEKCIANEFLMKIAREPDGRQKSEPRVACMYKHRCKYIYRNIFGRSI